ncbi:hypothetical protein LTR08_004054 [Meristemomyces frigidus]|nr:hypothetical protein LTR08_004054 [Meristemomyces frigidus]
MYDIPPFEEPLAPVERTCTTQSATPDTSAPTHDAAYRLLNVSSDAHLTAADRMAIEIMPIDLPESTRYAAAIDMIPQPTRAPYPPVRVNFVPGLEGAERTVFLQLKANAPTQPTMKEIRSACHKALGNIQVNDTVEEARALVLPIYIIRFEDIKAARHLSGRSVLIQGVSYLTQSYPTKSPQAYVTTIKICGQHAVSEDCILSSLATFLPGNAVHLRREKNVSGEKRILVAVFQTPPQLLRFTVSLLRADGLSYISAHFDAVSLSDACRVCHKGHPAVKCDLLGSMGAEDLGVQDEDPRYLQSLPNLR